MVGLSKGRVPKDIDLLDRDVSNIQSRIDAYISGDAIPNSVNEVYRRSAAKSDSSESGVDLSVGPQSGFSAPTSLSYPGSGSGSGGSGSASTFIHDGGPTMVRVSLIPFPMNYPY